MDIDAKQALKEDFAKYILKKAFRMVAALGLSAGMDFGCNIDSVRDVNEHNFKFYPIEPPKEEDK